MLLICFISVNSLTDFEQFVKRRPTPFVPNGWPVIGHLTSFFGLRWHPIKHHRHFHQGIDIASPQSTPVKATARGQIKSVGYKKGYGKCVVIDHGHGWETLYAHLQSSPLRQGDIVISKQFIGKVGISGSTTGPHLHYEVRYLDQPQDPLHFIGGFDRPMFSQLEGWHLGASFHQD